MGGSLAEIKEASIMGPVACTVAQATAAGYESGTRGEYCYAATTTSANAQLPTVTRADGKVAVTLQGKFVDFYNSNPTATLWVGFGVGSAPTIVAGQLSAFGTGHVSAGRPIGPMSGKGWIVPPGVTHVAWILDAGASASVVAIGCSEGQV